MGRTPYERPDCDQLLELLPEAYMIIDSAYRIVAANQKYRERYGVSEDEVVGRRCHEVSHRSTVPCHENGEHCPLLEVFGKSRPTNVVHIHYDKDGGEERVQLKASPLFDADGNVAFMAEALVTMSNKDPAPFTLVGRSKPMLHLASLLQRVAATTTTVLLQGESGVGKECAAHYLHHYSDRHSGPFVVVDCGMLGENLIERELFGHEKGAFTGANARKPGLFEAADGGTLVIDEISELPFGLQTKLLRVLETGTFRRIGGTEYVKVDVRIVAATNSSLPELVEQGRFRRDLYYRLSAFPVTVPALRDHQDDIPALAEHFLTNIESGVAQLPLSTSVIEALLEYDYPGNVRELRNILERANVLAAGSMMAREHLVFEPVAAPAGRAAAHSASWLAPNTTRDKSEAIFAALRASGGNRAHAAQMLGISERTVYRYLSKFRGGSMRAPAPVSELVEGE